MDVLTIQGLTKRYPGFLLADVGFTVRQGEIMGFIGRNGAGKTTTLKSLLNFVHPDAGDIRFFGLPFAQNEFAIKQRIGFVSGGADFYLHSPLRTITGATRAFYPN
jgi:ABC-2 type transport system ATP-binding protein